MPITPFHFGPGLLVKAVLPRRVSWLSFAVSQIVIDCEPLWRFATGVRPLHGPLHTVIVATPVGLAAGGLLGFVASRLFPRTFGAHPVLRAEAAVAAGMLGGAIGGASHPLIDGLMHPDVHPFWPFVAGNPLLGLVPLSAIYLGCVVTGVAGAWILWRGALAARGSGAVTSR